MLILTKNHNLFFFSFWVGEEEGLGDEEGVNSIGK